MGTVTAFMLTGDNQTTSYPDDGTWPTSSVAPNSPGAGSGRYARIGASGSTVSYPAYNDDGFNSPKIRFMFLDAYGEKMSGSPTVYLRLPNVFNLTNFSDYSKADSIFGGSTSGGASAYTAIATGALGDKVGTAVGDAADTIAKAGISGAEAFQYSLKKGLASMAGFGGSAGLSNIGQWEFLTRKSVNPMAQLLYKGPQFRRYQIPFLVKPRNAADSANIKKIISIFRVASSPSVPDTSGTGIGSINIGEGNSFTFGYPHLTQFTMSFIQPPLTVKNIYRSKPCVIESVSVDYGSQKMTFFEDGSPTEMTLTLQLTEVMPRTLGDAISDGSDPNRTMA